MPWESRIPELSLAALEATAAAVEWAGFAMERIAKSRARVDTGFMRGEIRFEMLDRFEGELRGNAEYTIFHEYGTRYMAAQPMFGPAAEEIRPGFEERVRLAWSL
jgi:hypothetical protein